MTQPLYWHQGLLLQPQHFQLESQFHQWQLSQTRSLTQNYPWGVVSLDIRETALSDKQFVIQKCEVLFPDGSLCQLHENTVIASRQFEEDWVETGKSFPVYIGLKHWQANGHNVTEVHNASEMGEVSSRYAALSNPQEVVDYYGEGAPGQVKPLQYVIKVFWENELDVAGDYHLIPIARLERDGQRIFLSERFLPPVTNLHKWSQMRSLIRDILDQLVSRAKQLERFKKPTSAKRMASGDGDVTLTLAMRSLNRCACQIQCLVESPVLSPWEAWKTLSEILAELSSFVTDFSVVGEPGLDRWPSYDHLELFSVFECCQQQLTQMLHSIVVGPEYALRFEPQHGAWHTQLPERALSGEYRYWLWLEGFSPSQYIELASRIKVCASVQLPNLMARAVSGIPLIVQHETPAGLPRAEDGIYCELDCRSPLWRQVVESQSLGVGGIAPEHANMQLFITRG
ncbi:type VI secretion system baseplate subunit TssK [Vibrio sp. S4M6]|uniref:type VI secretion system baseplate subunit TssK n=1 Tax=Vibrio sinus TaxID=2946865 RepID=UPI00202A99BB|nr:type VI secretion system baseplate subunit TssK [Vibrio sinus]MCL9782511.1 type VI secretion system baseplate subunit TssK [Vibrio sinus]